MKCQRCQKREASVLIKQIVNGAEKEYKICEDCLQEIGFANTFGLDLDNYLGTGFASPKAFLGNHQLGNTATGYNSGVFVPGKQEPKVCAHCNTSLDEIRKKGKLGCSYCYEIFEDQLGQVFRRVQSGDKHRGRKIAQTKDRSEINNLHQINEELQLKIKEAVEKEDYESAAKIKTEILQNKAKIENIENIEKLKKPKSDTNSTLEKHTNHSRKIHEVEILGSSTFGSDDMNIDKVPENLGKNKAKKSNPDKSANEKKEKKEKKDTNENKTKPEKANQEGESIPKKPRRKKTNENEDKEKKE